MSFTKIALRNIRKKFRSYLIFFFSTAFSVLIFNLFCSLYYNPSFEAFRFGTGKMTTLFLGSAIAVLIFSTIFVFYSGSYFIRSQKKEIALYALLGMPKEQIALMMFLETFFIGILSVFVGTFVGTISAGFFTTILMGFMATGTEVEFIIEKEAMTATLIAFIVLFIINGIRAYVMIYRYKLIELITAEKKNEGLPSFSVFSAFLGVILIISGYILSATINMNDFGFRLLLPAFTVILLVSLGTFLIFRNLVPFVITLIKKNKTFYYLTTNFISTSQIAFRLKANSGILAVAAILSAVTITTISASFSLYKGLEDGTDYYAPFSYLVKNITSEQHSEVNSIVKRVGDVRITAEDRIELINVSLQHPSYSPETQGENIAIPGQNTAGWLLSETTYLKIITDTMAAGEDETNLVTDFAGGLGTGECFFIDGNVTAQYSADLPGQELNLRFKDINLALIVSGTSLHKYLGLLDLYRHPTVVVNDETFQRFITKATDEDMEVFFGFMFDDEMGSAETVGALDAFLSARFSVGGLPPNLSYIGFYRSNFALYGSYVFVGLFVGILFLLATGSVLYYKMIMEAQEEATRYQLLMKAGMQKREMLITIAKQLGMVFGFPLLVGLSHTIMALQAYNRMLDLMGQETPTMQNALVVVAIFISVYGLFYLLSIKSYQSIVNA